MFPPTGRKMQKRTSCWTRNLAPILCTAALVSGCGGGGNTSSTNPIAVTNFPVSSVITKLVTNGASFTGKNTGPADGQSTISVVYVPGATGTVVRRQTITSIPGSPTLSKFSLSFQLPSNLFQVTGFTSNTGDNAVITEGKPLPATTDVGKRDNLFKGSLLISNNGINTSDIGLTHFLSYDWTLDAANNSSADLCLSFQESADFVTNTTIDCFRIDEKGAIFAFKSSLRVQAKSIDSLTVYQ